MSSSSAMQTAFVLIAIASQSVAFMPSHSMSVYRGVGSSLSDINRYSSPVARNNYQLSMALNFGKNNKKDQMILESTSLDMPKEEKGNGLTRWVKGIAWPSKKELKKLLPLGTMLFFILFNYTILRDTKVCNMMIIVFAFMYYC